MHSAPSHLQLTFAGMTALAVAMGVGRFAFTPVLPIMQLEGLLTLTGAGLLASIHFLGYWLGSLSATWQLVWSANGLRLVLLLIVLGTFAMGLTDWYPLWCLLRLAVGVLSAWAFVLVGHVYGNRLADAGRFGLQGWVLAGVGAGIAATGLLALVFMVRGVDSSGAWCWLGLISAAGVLLVFKHLAPGDRDSPAPRRAGSRPVYGDWRLIIAYAVSGMGYSIPATFLPVMARQAIPDPYLFGWCWPVFGFAAMAATLAVSRLQGRCANRRLWAAAHLVMATGIFLPVLHPTITAFALAGMAVGGTFLVTTLAALRESHALGGANAHRLLALLTTAFATGQILGPLLAAYAHYFLGNFTLILVVTGALLVATAVSLVYPSVYQESV